MKTFTFIIALVVAFAVCTAGAATNKYVGVKACSPCHKAAKIPDIWQSSKHSQAFTALTAPAADSIAKARGSKKPAVETKECLGCHTIQVAADQMDKTFNVKDGVQCETCHGAGSAFKTISVMKDHAKAVAAGLADYKDKAAVEAKCKSCHNEKSPTFKGFKFDEMYPKIKHSKKV